MISDGTNSMGQLAIRAVELTICLPSMESVKGNRASLTAPHLSSQVCDKPSRVNSELHDPVILNAPPVCRMGEPSR